MCLLSAPEVPELEKFLIYDEPEEEEDEKDWQPLTIQDAETTLFALLSELATVPAIDDGPHVGGGYESIHLRGCPPLASGDRKHFACKDRTHHI